MKKIQVIVGLSPPNPPFAEISIEVKGEKEELVVHTEGSLLVVNKIKEPNARPETVATFNSWIYWMKIEAADSVRS